MKYKIKEGAVLPSSFKIKVDTEQLEVLKRNCNIPAKIEGIYIFHYTSEVVTYSDDIYVFRDHDLEEIQFKDYFEEVLDFDANAAEAYHNYRMAKYKEQGLILLPKSLTAENGAKALLMGEFELMVETSGRMRPFFITVPWTTIKDIYKTVVEHFKDNHNELDRVSK